ncbi:hypothetical protein C804_01104 [Lachnospiraceae bacterium A4]|jgi:hypothetical protein|nr:hypothetical protein C804_01104 [Lachnospiraceae bacterium A4]
MIENELKPDKKIGTESLATPENEDITKKAKRQSPKNDFKEKECPVISYNKHSKTLDVMFDNYGIRIINIESFVGNTVNIRYKGEIGKPDFEFKI